MSSLSEPTLGHEVLEPLSASELRLARLLCEDVTQRSDTITHLGHIPVQICDGVLVYESAVIELIFADAVEVGLLGDVADDSKLRLDGPSDLNGTNAVRP